MTTSFRKPPVNAWAVGDLATGRQGARVSRFARFMLRKHRVGPETEETKAADMTVIESLTNELNGWAVGVPLSPTPPTGGRPPGYNDQILANGVLNALERAGLSKAIWINETLATASLAVDLMVAVRWGLRLMPRKPTVPGDVSRWLRARPGAKKLLDEGRKITRN